MRTCAQSAIDAATSYRTGRHRRRLSQGTAWLSTLLRFAHGSWQLIGDGRGSLLQIASYNETTIVRPGRGNWQEIGGAKTQSSEEKPSGRATTPKLEKAQNCAKHV